MAIHGTAGNDTLVGTGGDDLFKLWQGGNDTADGGDGNDIFRMRGTLNAADRITGGDGTDMVTLNGDYSAGLIFDAATIVGVETLRLAGSHDYDLTMNDGNVAAGESLTVNAGLLGAGHHMTFDGAAELDGHFTIQGSAGNDDVAGGAQRDKFYLDRGGNDAADGGGGNDAFYLGAALTASDTIDGGIDTDTVTLNGNYSGFAFGASTIANIEALLLGGGHDYDLTFDDGNVLGTTTLTLDASALGAGDTLFALGGAESDGSFAFIAGAGEALLVGGGQDDSFDLENATSPHVVTANGNNGNDVFNFAANFSVSFCSIEGGNGADTLSLDGDYAGVTLSAIAPHGVNDVENVIFEGGHSYSGVSVVGDLANGATLTVDASALGASDTLSIDLSGATSAGYDVTGGAGDDSFNFGDRFLASDQLDGGAGYDILTITGSGGADDLSFSATTMTNIDKLIVNAPGVWMDTNDATVAAGMTLTVDASSLSTSFQFTGLAETDGSFDITGGSNNDGLTGGAQADTFDLTLGGNDQADGGGGDDTIDVGGKFGAADIINGGSGFDVVTMTGVDAADVIVFNATTMTNIDKLIDNAASVSVVTDNATVASGETLIVDGSGLAAGGIVFNGSAETNGHFTITGGGGLDNITAGGLSDTIDGAGGNDLITGGGGADDITCGSGADKLIYSAVSQSNSAAYDRVHGFDAAADFFDMPFAVTSVSTASHAISAATFDTDMGAAISDQLCCVVTASGGDLMGHVFLFVDGVGGGGGYQAGLDYIIDITAYTGTLTTGNFI